VSQSCYVPFERHLVSFRLHRVPNKMNSVLDELIKLEPKSDVGLGRGCLTGCGSERVGSIGEMGVKPHQ